MPHTLFAPYSHATQDPVIAADGYAYERAAIQNWFTRGGRRSPMTGAALATAALVPNHPLRSAICEWREAKGGRRR